MDAAPAFAPVAAPWVWTADELSRRDGWVFHLDDAAEELDAAVAALLGSGRAVTETTEADFPLPSLGPTLERVAGELRDGSGVALIRGLDVAAYDRAGLEALLWGLGAHLGVARPQSYRGDMIGDVMDMSHTGDTRRSYRSPRPLALHVDPVDIVGLLCHRTAREGGQSLIASGMAIYNTILAERPDLLPALCRGFYYRHSEAESSGETPTAPHRVPVFKTVGGRLVCNFNAPPILRRFRDEGPDDADAHAALEFFLEVARRDSLVCRLDFAPGDLQFLNNRAVLHGRTEFDDWPGLERKRHLLRLWLNPPGWPDWPADMYWRPAGERQPQGAARVP